MKRTLDPDRPCAACGATLHRKRFGERLEERGCFLRRKYCDRLCMAAAMTQDQPTLTAIKARNKHLRGPLCQECGTVAQLQIHHIDGNKFNNNASNLMTLCASCHSKWHWENGKRMPNRRAACSICGTPARKLGYCQKHYQRFRKYGDPRVTKKKNGLRYELVEDHGSDRKSQFRA